MKLYWTGSRVGEALYVLKGNSYVRISIGGSSDPATKIKRSKAPAEKAIARLYRGNALPPTANQLNLLQVPASDICRLTV
jgi:hypothetical protein